jgi:hypothetical protein
MPAALFPAINRSSVRLAIFALLVTQLTLAQNSPNPGLCQVRVAANQVIVSNRERVETGYHVLPPDVIPAPGQWPYFAWSDTSLGVLRNGDGSYTFFGSDGGCHKDCSTDRPRWGSVTISQGSLDHPLGEPQGDPVPPPYEFTFPNTHDIPQIIDYAGGGPVYRVPEGEPGAGTLLLVYHTEQPANPFYSRTGIAKSTDEGYTWQDLGTILTVPHPYDPTGATDVGENPLVPYNDPITHQKYFYIFFPQHCWTATAACSDFTYISVARVPYRDLLITTAAGNSVSNLFRKYYEGKWDQPGIGGMASETFPGVTGETDGDFQIVWSDYRKRFIAMVDNAQYIAYGESVDGTYWPPMQVVYTEPNLNAVVGYANAVGLGDDPGVLDSTFYSYYTSFPVPDYPWEPATLNRLTITTAATVTSLVPSSASAGSSGFTLTLNGEGFVSDSRVSWNGSPLSTAFVSPNLLTARIPAPDVAQAGEANIAVSNPDPCGGLSNVAEFTIVPGNVSE